MIIPFGLHISRQIFILNLYKSRVILVKMVMINHSVSTSSRCSDFTLNSKTVRPNWILIGLLALSWKSSSRRIKVPNLAWVLARQNQPSMSLISACFRDTEMSVILISQSWPLPMRMGLFSSGEIRWSQRSSFVYCLFPKLQKRMYGLFGLEIVIIQRSLLFVPSMPKRTIWGKGDLQI